MLRRIKTAIRALAGDVLDPSDFHSVEAFLRNGADLSGAAAKNCATVFSCIRVLSDTIAALPLKLYRVEGDKTLPAEQNPFYRVLAVRPCPWMDKFAYWKFNINCLLLRGLFVSHVIRDSVGRVMRLVPVDPMKIEVSGIKLSDYGELQFPIYKDGILKIYPSSELFFCYYETLDGVHPVTPLEFARATMRLAVNSERYGNQILDSGAVPSGYYKTDKKLSPEAFERMKDQLAKGGIGNSQGKTPILEEGINYNQVTMTANDLQMLETRRYQKEELCGIFGVPPHMIGDTSQAKGWSTMEQMMTEFVQLSLVPYLVRIENAITTRIIPDAEWKTQFAKFNVSGLLRGDLTSRTNYYRQMNMIGAMSANEIRDKEDMNAVEGGDRYYVQANMQTVKTEGNDNEQPVQ